VGGPAADDAVVLLHYPDAGGRAVAAGQSGLERPFIGFLPGLLVVGVGGVAGEGQVRGGLHAAQSGDELIVFRLRFVDQDVDTDRLGAERVDLGQRLGQQRSVERRAALCALERVVVEDDHHHARVLVDLRRGRHHPQVVERPFGRPEQRQPPAQQRHHQAHDHEQQRRHRTRGTNLAKGQPQPHRRIGEDGDRIGDLSGCGLGHGAITTPP